MFFWRLFGYPKVWRVWFGPNRGALVVRRTPNGPFLLIERDGNMSLRSRTPPSSIFRKPFDVYDN